MYLSKIVFKNCCALTLFFASFSVMAQSNGYDSTYRPDVYNSQVEQFSSFPANKKDIVFLGNSIMHWVNWNELTGVSKIKNRGIPGDMTFGVLDRLQETVKGKPAKIFVLIGINDISRNVPDSIILANYQKIIQIIKQSSPKTKIYFHTLLPVNPEFKKLTAHYKKDHIIAINKGLAQLAITQKITLIDIFTPFLDIKGNLDPSLTFDGVHLTLAGYIKWAEILKSRGYL